ncbi:MAG: type II toxin-antitoxin system VapC family toxin [Acetobacteraceae bacterium]|nr:type II toxin-antitoxin system VapC family toxin [Acetobacteraceae bacterium]
MTVVVDASVALKWFVSEDDSEAALGLLDSPELLIAPDLVVAEVSNAAWRAVRSGFMKPEQQDEAASRIGFAFDELVSLASLASRTVAISRLLAHPVYDCFYLALAEARSATLITADRRFLLRIAGTQWEGIAQDIRRVH